MIRRSRRAFTLIELVVYAALLGMLMTALYFVLTSVLRSFKEEQTATDLQSSAQVAVAQLRMDLGDSHAASIVTNSNPSAVIFPSPRDLNDLFSWDSAGNIFWWSWVCYYQDSSNNLWRKSITITPTSTPPTGPPSVASFVSAPGGRIVASNLTSFVVSTGAACTVQATFSKQALRSGDNALTVSVVVRPRN